MDAVSTLSILGGAGAVAVILLLWRPGKNKSKGMVGERIAVNASGDKAGDDAARSAPLDDADDWEVIPVSLSARVTSHGEAADGRAVVLQTDSEMFAVAPAEASQERVIVLNIMAGNGHSFHGAEIMNALTEVGMEYGEMDIFHYASEDAGGMPLFSLANAINPGTFDIHAMTDFTTPGLTLFMSLPGPLDGVAAFDAMHNTAARLAGLLGGTLCDGQRRLFTADMLEKQRIELLGVSASR
ncbi:MAG: cell division protein ZipA [Gammaproteobacteria bacterium]|nr:cell division protein ZipA [Gammaproteobacteria bacterium]